MPTSSYGAAALALLCLLLASELAEGQAPEVVRDAVAVPEAVRSALLSVFAESSPVGVGGGPPGRIDSVSVCGQELHLDETQRAALAEVLGARTAEPVVTRYLASRMGEALGYGYLDTHRVRTLSESLLIVLAPSGEVDRVVVLAFAEPPEYLPRPIWYDQFHGISPDRGIKYGREIDAVTGATLTGRATVKAVEHVQKLHGWLSLQFPQVSE